jgi:hypothetical protein
MKSILKIAFLLLISFCVLLFIKGNNSNEADDISSKGRAKCDRSHCGLTYTIGQGFGITRGYVMAKGSDIECYVGFCSIECASEYHELKYGFYPQSK